MKKSRPKLLIAYLIAFFISWSLYVFLIYPSLVRTYGTDSFLTASAGIFVRVLLWLLPVYMYLKYFDKVNPFEYLKLNVFNLKAVKFTFKGSLGYGLVYLVQFGLPHGPINLSWTAVFGVALTVGVFEETVFRGFILQKFAEHMSFWFANILSSILFTLIHFPGWFGIGLNPNISIASILAVTLLGLLMGALLKVTQSLWPAIIVHQVNDIFAAIIWKV